MIKIGNIRSISFQPSKFLIALLLSLFLLFAFRISILQAFGSFLVYESALPPSADAMAILSGSPYDRANTAVLLDYQMKVPFFICTGKNQSGDLRVFKDSVYECDLLQIQLVKNKVDSNRIVLLKQGTSTAEEADALLTYALSHQIDSLIIVSSKFHTRRIKSVFVSKYKKAGIEVFIHGAASSTYDETQWWKSENGLIALNNEYLKLLYYIVR